MVIELPPDFNEFLKLLNSHHVDYRVIGGFAVGFHGYPRSTSDMDTRISKAPENVNSVIGIEVTVIGLTDLRRNKTASGRPKDLDDLQQLP